MKTVIYFDNAATTMPDRDVLNTFVKVNETMYFNPSSPHKLGLQAEKLLAKSKFEIKRALGLADKWDMIFTSGATESNNIALKGVAYKKRAFANEIITSLLEHPSVLETVRALETEGFKVRYVNITPEGKIDLDHFESLLNSQVGLVTCMHVNNIMGQVQPIAEMAERIKAYPKIHFHVDAVQAIGKVPLQFEGVDSLSLSGHKFHGLKGQGILFLNNIHQLVPIVHGGGQEYQLRSGTVNLPMNIALVKAIRKAVEQQEQTAQHLRQVNSDIRECVSHYPGVTVHSPSSAAPHILNLGFPGVKGEVLVNAFSKYEVMLSTTSACSSRRDKLNEVLQAMRIPDKQIEGSIRLSFSSQTTRESVEQFKEIFSNVYDEIKEILKK